MSNALAIAAVTAMLKDILENRLANQPVAISMGDLLVTALPPDRVTVGSDERPQLNVFLYQVSQNRNADWIGRERMEAGQVLALDLHYLVTAYGAKDFQAELLLGYAMQVLHEIPLITREMLYVALKHAAAMTTFGALSQVLATLSIDELADQVGAIRLCPAFFSMEETSKLWSSLQTHYRPSAGYQASMVLLNRPTPEQPTLRPLVGQPTIERIEVGAIQAGSGLMIYGQRLQGQLTYLRMAGRSALLSPQAVENQQISLLLPPDLPAGIQRIQVVHLENPQQTDRKEILSNLVAFVLQPSLSVQVTSVKPVKSSLYQAELALTVRPFIHPGQPILLLLNHTSTDSPAIQLTIPAAQTLTETLTASVQVTAGDYWVQLQIDGARSEAITVEITA